MTSIMPEEVPEFPEKEAPLPPEKEAPLPEGDSGDEEEKKEE